MLPFYTTCPPSAAFAGPDYLAEVARVSRWSEDAGAEGMLIYTDNSLVDPWCVADAVMTASQRLLPLVAVQPFYIPPFTVAKRIASLAFLHGRGVALNMVAGGFVNDLVALGDSTPHDERYERLLEYTHLIQVLLRNETVTFNGRHYTLAGATLAPTVDTGLLPKYFVSGSSSAGADVAASLGAIAVNYPPAPEDLAGPVSRGSFARVGIIAADTDESAWEIAHRRFPSDRRGEMKHRLATAVSDSVWHRTLAERAQHDGDAVSPYWLHPLRTYRTFCPYLVGSHAKVGAILAEYRRVGFEGFILDIPQSENDLAHAVEALRQSAPLVAAKPAPHGEISSSLTQEYP